MDDAQQARQDAEAPADDPGAAAEPLLAAGRGRRRRWSVPWLTVVGFAFLTFNSGMAIYRSGGERWAVAFVAFSYLDLVLLFGCLRLYETAEPGSARRPRLKVAVWTLTTALTVLFSAKVAAVMPAAVAVVVWVMAFATIAGGFYAFFLYSDKHGDI
ncbi:uncharacterized protein LOC120655097 [Panicum virgatum]|uniref:Uncharacterized protein n=1 Tax=Panicum virgatum TaxID=38727 RepID=A0A8T0WT97_PANVG|nr:uncharacterized protein LOC120655097 [Panicum virgatum]KAG2649517.1 hypothetical protein PVAP13_1NG114290 [Panicum virgatum]